VLFWLKGTYCQQREVEAITEDVEGDDGIVDFLQCSLIAVG